MTGVKVLQLVEDFEIGGLERVVATLYEGLTEKGYEVNIWCLVKGGELAEQFILQKKNIRVLGLDSYHNPVNILKLALLIRKNSFHIVHSHGYFTNTFGRIAAFIARTPIIISHVHTTYYGFKKRHIVIERLLSKCTNKIICCSQAIRDFVVRFLEIPDNKTEVIYNGIFCKRQGTGLNKQDAKSKTEVTLLIIASLVENKGHQYLIDALHKLKNRKKKVKLLIVGDGPLKVELKDYAATLGIKEKIVFLGIQDNVHDILEDSDILVLPSVEREGMGISIIEAMSMAKPVIGTSLGGIPEVIEDGVNGYLAEPRNSKDLADKLEILIDNITLRQRMGKEGRDKFELRFEAKTMLEKLEGLYRSLLKHRGIGTPRILYLHNKTNISGGEQSLLNLWQNLDRKKYSPHLIIPSDGQLGQEARQIGLEVNYHEVPKLIPLNFIKILKLLFIFRRLCKKQRISIIHSYTPRNNILAAFLGKIMRIPVIWHERNLIFASEIEISSRFSFLPDQIICNSNAVAQRFKKNEGIPSKVNVVINGVDLNKFRPGKVDLEILQKYNLNGRKIVGLISNLGKRKMPELLLNASPYLLKKHPNTIFLIVGGEFAEEDRGRREELERKANSLGVGDSFIFTGFVSNVSDIIQVFDVGVAVTEKEACSRAILEIMACGKPVVAFDTGGNSELIDDGVTGTLVDFGDIKGFASAVVDLLRDDNKRTRMAMKARERAEKYFDVKINAQKTQGIYSRLLGWTDS